MTDVDRLVATVCIVILCLMVTFVVLGASRSGR